MGHFSFWPPLLLSERLSAQHSEGGSRRSCFSRHCEWPVKHLAQRSTSEAFSSHCVLWSRQRVGRLGSREWFCCSVKRRDHMRAGAHFHDTTHTHTPMYHTHPMLFLYWWVWIFGGSCSINQPAQILHFISSVCSIWWCFLLDGFRLDTDPGPRVQHAIKSQLSLHFECNRTRQDILLTLTTKCVKDLVAFYGLKTSSVYSDY